MRDHSYAFFPKYDVTFVQRPRPQQLSA